MATMQRQTHLTYNEKKEWLAWRAAWAKNGARKFPKDYVPTGIDKLMVEWRQRFPRAYSDIKAGRTASIARFPIPHATPQTDPRQIPLPGIHRRRKAPPVVEAKFPRRKFASKEGCVVNLKIGRYHGGLAPNNPYDVCITRNQWKKLFPKAPLGKLPKKLGGGVFATAFATGKDTVVKITNDPSDAVAYKMVHKAGIEHVPKLIDMFRLTSTTDSSTPVIAMRMERLRGTMHQLYPQLSPALSCVRRNFAEYDPDDLTAACCDNISSAKRRRGRGPANVGAMCQKLVAQIGPTLLDLDSLGIDSAQDLHDENLGVTKEYNWAIHDLGLSGREARTKDLAPSLAGAKHARKRR